MSNVKEKCQKFQILRANVPITLFKGAVSPIFSVTLNGEKTYL